MTIEEKQYLISSIKERKNVFDKLGIKLMDNADMQIAELMADFTPSVVPEFNPTGLITSQTKAFNKSFDYLEIFGTEITDKAKKIVANTKIYPMYNVPFCYSTNITYGLDTETEKVDKNSGTVDHYKTSTVFDEVSPLWLAHENIHALKETNYDEYVDAQIIGDVIPMFLELVMADEVSPDKASTLLRNRLFLLKNEYTTTQQMRSVLPKDLYNIYATSAMQYLNSFNYAIQLYQRYMYDKENVISKAKEVLLGKNTTRNMLDEFAILYEYNPTKVQHGINKVLSKIK